MLQPYYLTLKQVLGSDPEWNEKAELDSEYIDELFSNVTEPELELFVLAEPEPKP